ncbi:MAG TPA: hypothetical protein VHB49_25035 [Bradyrhizobium sp.]|nr:hypothetical protein [Bradyrhizobium sp.]
MSASAWRMDAAIGKSAEAKEKRVETKSFRPFLLRRCLGATMPADLPPLSGSGFHLGVEIGDHILERRNRLLNCRNLDQLPARHRAFAVLQRDHQIPPLFLELDKWQTVIRQMSHHDIPTPWY